jgi:AcrR family transcriptional regulator
MNVKPKRSTAADDDPASAAKFVDRYKAQLAGLKSASKGDRTRFRLKIATAQLLEKTGFQDMRVSDIAKQAKVALGTFYLYFTDKNAITGEVMMDFGDDLYQRAQLIARGRRDFEAIFVTNRFFVVNYQNNAGLVRCLLQLDDLLPEFGVRWRARRQNWIEAVAHSISRRSGNVDAPRKLFLQIAYALEGLVVHYLYELFIRSNPLLKEFKGNHDEIAEMLSVLWYRAVYLEDPPADMIRHAKSIFVMHRPRMAKSTAKASGALRASPE